MNLINEHKNFILTVLGGTFVFLLCMYFIGTIFDQVDGLKDEIQTTEGRIEKNIEKLKTPSQQKGLKYHRSLSHVLETPVLSEIKQKLLFFPSELFRWKKGEKNPSFYFSTKKSEIARRLSLMADRYSFNLNDLGFSKTTLTETEVEEYLIRLEMVEKVLTHGIVSGLKKVTSINPEQEATLYAIPGTAQGLRRIPLKLILVGESKALLDFLSAFGKEREPSSPLPNLELLELVITPSDNEKWLTVQIKLAALFLIPLKEKTPDAQSEPTSKRGWGGRSLIRKMR